MSEFDTPELSSHRISLQKELRSAQIMADSLQKELITYNDKRFSLLKEYVNSESDNIAHLQSIVDLLKTDITDAPRELIADISTSSARSTRLLAEFNAFQDSNSQENISQNGGLDEGLEKSKNALQSKL